MKQLFVRMKFQYYLITLVIAVALFIIVDARPAHILDSPYIYGYYGHVLLLVLSLLVSIYLRVKNARHSWLYPICNALIVYTIVPHASLIFINDPRVTSYFFSYHLFFGFFFIFLPHIVISFLGIGFGYLIQKITSAKF